MDVLKRILSLVLAAALLLASLPAMPLNAFAEEYVEAEEPAAVDETTVVEETAADAQTEAAEEGGAENAPEVTVVEVPFQVNPRYEGVLDESDFAQTQTQAPQVSLLSDYGTEAEAAVQIRENLKARAETFTVYYTSTNSAFEEVSHELFEAAISHTGVPTEGDYLAWQYGGWKSTISISSSGGVYYCTTTYTVTYYTTAAQEAEMDAAVDSLLAELNPTGSDYKKIRTVYDYICGNVTYDYDNLNDANYKLKYTAYAALINKTSVCQGYAVLLYRLALEMGIDCRLISGYGNSEAHGWNIIRLGSLYYNADATWDAGDSTYNYFLRSDANFGAHTRDEAYASESFYSVYPMSETDYDPDAISCGEDLTWTLDAEGTLTISGTGAMYDYETEKTPWYSDSTRITKAVVEKGVTRIGKQAFQSCTALAEVTLPEGLETIGYSAFNNCQSLTQIVFPASLTSIDLYAFVNTGLERITFTGDVPDIGSTSFSGVTAKVFYPIGNETWNTDVMQNYGGSLTWIVLCEAHVAGETVKEKEIAAGCETGGSYEDVVYCSVCGEEISRTAVTTEAAGHTEYVSIAETPAACTQTGLTEQVSCSACGKILVQQEEIAALGHTYVDDVCQTCGEIRVIGGTCGDSLSWAFDKASGMLTVSGAGEMPDYTAPGGNTPAPWADYNDQITAITVEAGVTSVGNYAFYQNAAVTAVLADSVTSIGICAFGYAEKMVSVDLGTGVTSIGNSAFVECNSLLSIEIPEGVTTLEMGVLSRCAALEDVTLPGTLEEIGEDAFLRCTSLETIVIPEGVTTIGFQAFKYCCALKNVTIPATVTEIKGYAFYQCAVKNPVIPGSVKTIGDYAFYQNGTLNKLTLSEGLESIGKYAFCMAYITGELAIPDSVTTIGEEAFSGNAITSLRLPAGNVTMGTGVFSGCTDLVSVTVPAGLTELEDYTFSECTSLTGVAIPEGVTAIGEASFSGCSSLTGITIPASVTSIESYAFWGCCGLTEIVFEGDAPAFGYSDPFSDVVATAYYPADNATWTETVMQDYGGSLTWEAYTPETQTISQAEFEAARIAAIEAGEESCALTKALTLTSNLTIGAEIMVTIEEGGSITVPDGLTLTIACDIYRMQGEIIVENGGTLHISEYGLTPNNGGMIKICDGGNLVIEEDAYLIVAYQGKLTAQEGAIINAALGCITMVLRSGAVIEGIDNSRIYATYEIFFDDGTPLSEFIEEGSSYGRFMLRPLLALTQTEEILEIPENTAFNICGFTIPEGMTIINHGTIEVEMDRLVVNGTLDNQGTVLMYDGKMLEVNGTMTGNDAVVEDLTMTQADLQAKIDAALEESGGSGGLTGFSENVVLTSDLEVPADMDVEMVVGGITVSTGVTLTINGNLSAYNYPYIIVKNGGGLIINGKLTASSSASIIIEEGADVQVNGTLNIRGNSFYEGIQTQRACYLTIADGAAVQVNGTMTVGDGVETHASAGIIATPLSNAANITGIDGLFTVTSHPADGAELAACAAEGAAYDTHKMTVDTAVTLTQNTNIPNNTQITVTGEGVTLTVPGGYTLTNAGSILLETGTRLQVLEGGTLTNRGTIAGEVVTAGTVIENAAEDLDNVVSNADSMTEEEIRTAVQDMDTEELAAEMTAGTSVLENIAVLEEKVGGAAEVTVDESCAFASEQVSIVGANLNTVQSGETMKLVITTADAVEIPEEYDSTSALCFSMTLEGAVDPENLEVPVAITLPVPEGMDTENLVILHYHEDGTMDVIEPAVIEEEGQYFASFVLTSFSDFVMTVAAAVTSGSCGDGLSWVFDEASGTLTISGEGFMSAYSKAERPWYPFMEDIKAVVVKEGVSTISMYAFCDCTALVSVEIADSVNFVGSAAFDCCTSLEEVRIPNGIVGLRNSFTNCTKLSKVTVSEGVRMIYEGAFDGCTGLGTIVLEGAPLSVNGTAFEGVTADVYYPAANKAWTEALMESYGGNINWIAYDFDAPTSGSCGENVTWKFDKSIGMLTISGTGDMDHFVDDKLYAPWWPSWRCEITAVVIEDGVTNIGMWAFAGCDNLNSLTVGADVAVISAAYDTLTTVWFTGDAPYCGIPDVEDVEVFYGMTATAYYPEGNQTWTEEAMAAFGGDITWISYRTDTVLAGDMNGDSVVDDTDVAQLLWHTLFPESYEIAGSADFTDDGVVDDSDVAYLLWYTLFPDMYPL